MKTCLLILIILSSSAFAGECRLEYNSQEAGRLRFMSIHRQTFQTKNLASCIQRAESNLGRSVRATSLVRDEMRTLTSVRYHYHSGRTFSTGSILRR